MKNIVVITDCYDVAFNEIRTKIIEILGDRIDEVSIEPVVKVKEFSLINCCFLTRLMAENYPEGTAFLVLCSPTIEKPNRIYGVTKKKKLLFFGPNNGVLTWLIKDFGVEEIYISENRSDKEYHPFGGKIDYAPTIAKMILVENLKSLTIGREAKIDEIKTLEIPDGSIVHIDNFGSCKIKGNLPHIKEGSRVKIDINGKFIYATSILGVH